MLTSGSLCTECHCEIPGGRGKECENCYWSRTFQKRLLLDANALGAQVVVDDFLAFGAWLAAKGGNQRAALSIHRHFEFFAVIDAQWAGMPPAKQLLEHIGCEGLRRTRAPIRWYKLAKQFVINDELLELHVEHERVRKVLSGISFGADRALLDDYLTTLKHGKVETSFIAWQVERGSALATAGPIRGSECSRATSCGPPLEDQARYCRQPVGIRYLLQCPTSRQAVDHNRKAQSPSSQAPQAGGADDKTGYRCQPRTRCTAHMDFTLVGLLSSLELEPIKGRCT
ncbi:hypothetical protein LVW35_27900 [Pseudomonas sp. HN11]|uniref:hypothetical protein n=1 Tax=Pseudomonas sp. HN11 TaxID=1344094 RepID=UPI001F2939C9|nr:hypothetical protein [Pseudomonas sp. HN11]UII71406.1 hypothetical protein LVW35_27900 [Pseudomonas sp. HN11]